MANLGPRFGPRDFKWRFIPEEGVNEGKAYSVGDVDTVKIATGGSTKEIVGLDGAVLSIVPGIAKPTIELGLSTSEEGVGFVKHLSGGEGGAYGTRFTSIGVAQRRGVNGGNPRVYEIPGCVLSDGGGLDLGSDSPPKDSIKAAGVDLKIDGESLFRENE